MSYEFLRKLQYLLTVGYNRFRFLQISYLYMFLTNTVVAVLTFNSSVMSTEDDDDTNPSQRFWNKLNYLLTVGYNQDVIDTFKNYCLDEDFDEEAITDDFDDITDSSITEHLQENYDWNDKKRNDFFFKARQALDIDEKPHRNSLYSHSDGSDKIPEIEQTCKAISEYYKSMNKPYNKKFSKYCYDADVTDLDDCLDDVNPADCQLIEFDDDNFPLPKELITANKQDQQQFIFDTIKSCYYNYQSIQFSNKLPKLLFSPKISRKYLHNIDMNDIEKVDEIYEQQCKAIWNAGMNTENNFKYMAAIGLKFKFPYLQHLVNAYLKARIEDQQKGLTVAEWCNSIKHITSLKQLKVPSIFVDKDKKKSNEDEKKDNEVSNVMDIVKHSITSFGKRTVPYFNFKNPLAINDSLEITVRYIHEMVFFIGHVLTHSEQIQKPACPFQIDFVIAYDEPLSLSEDENKITYKGNDDDDDDDDNNDNKDDSEFIDCIGDIESKLKKNGVNYVKGDQQTDLDDDFPYGKAREFDRLYKQFLKKHGIKEGHNSNSLHLHQKRMIVLLDRRHNKNHDYDDDDVYMYEAPSNCRDIPNDATGEWYINASRTCLLPNMDYGDGKYAEGLIDKTKLETKQNGKEKENLALGNVNSYTHCKGSVLTISFTVEEKDCISCKLYWNGQMNIFEPDDIKKVFPTMFNMKWNGYDDTMNDNNDSIDGKSKNEKFLENICEYQNMKETEYKTIDDLIKDMNDKIKNIQFNNFHKNVMSVS